MNTRTLRRVFVALTALTSGVASFAQTDSYTFLYYNGDPIRLVRTNNAGVSVGEYDTGGIFYKDGVGTPFSLPGTPGLGAFIRDLNDAKSIVGEYFTASAPFVQGFLLKANLLIPLQVPGGGRSTPQGMNNHDVVVGTYNLTGSVGPTGAFVYKNGTYTTFRVTGYTFTNLWDVNDAGDAVGEAGQNAPNSKFSFLYRDGVITPLPTYPGAAQTRMFSINNRGEMTGVIEMPGVDGDEFGFVLRNGIFELFRPFGSISISPVGINDRGDVTGTYLTPVRVAPNVYSHMSGPTFIRHSK